MLRKILFVLGIILVAVSVCLLVSKVTAEEAVAAVAETDWQNAPLSTVTLQPMPTQQIVTVTASATVQPTPTQMPVDGYVLDDVIDLASGKPSALAIRLLDGGLLVSNWAGAVGYSEDDDQETIFLPGKGIVYSYLGDTLVTQAHSGISLTGQRYFATNIELYLRKNSSGKTVSLTEAQARADSLKGSTAYLCQLESGEKSFLTDFDGTCTGKIVELELVAAAIVPHELVGDYNGAVLKMNEWLLGNFPESGFEQLTRENGWMIEFCVSQLSGQTSDETPWYLYNRGVLGFRIRE